MPGRAKLGLALSHPCATIVAMTTRYPVVSTLGLQSVLSTMTYIRSAANTISDTISDDDQDMTRALHEIASIRDACDDAEAAIVATMRQRGMSWQKIADALGITRQAAQKRHDR